MTPDAGGESEHWFAVHTAPRKEFVVAQALRDMQIGEVFLPVLLCMNPPGLSPTASSRKPLLFSHYVFVREEKGLRAALAEVKKKPGVRAILGTSTTELSPIPGCEINVLKNLCRGEIPPEWIPIPERGMKARIRRGPMAGATGIVLRRSARSTVLAFSMPILAGAYELVVPTSDLVIQEKKRGSREPGNKPRHRAGRRMKRRRKPEDIAENTPAK